MKAPHISLLYSFLSQILGFCAGLYIQTFESYSFIHIIIHSCVAWLITHVCKLSYTWQLVNFILPFAISYILCHELPLFFWFLSGLCILIYIPTFVTKVPFYPSGFPIYRAILEELPAKKINFLDAGCGSANLLCFLASERPESNFVGVELNPIIFLMAKMKAIHHKNIQIYYRNFWHMTFNDIDVLYTFLAPPFMPAIWEKAKAELPKNSLLMSNSFPIKARAKKIRRLSSGRQDALFVYEIK